MTTLPPKVATAAAIADTPQWLEHAVRKLDFVPFSDITLQTTSRY